MNRKTKRILAVVLLCGCFFGTFISAQAEENKNDGIKIPQSYEEVSGNVTFKLQPELPESFDSSAVPVGASVEPAYADPDKALELFGHDSVVKELHQNPTSHPDHDDYSYIFGEGSGNVLTVATATVHYSTKVFQYYTGFWDAEADDLSNQTELEFSDIATCLDDVVQRLETIGLSTDVQCAGFTMEAERLDALESHFDPLGEVESESFKDEWTGEDSAYVLYGRQMYGGLPVLCDTALIGRALALDDWNAASLLALYTERGIEYFTATSFYEFGESKEYARLKPFEDIVAVVDKKLNNVLSQEPYLVYRAKLYQLVRKNEKQEYEMGPAWYFEYTVEGNEEYRSVVLVDGVTGRVLSSW